MATVVVRGVIGSGRSDRTMNAGWKCVCGEKNTANTCRRCGRSWHDNRNKKINRRNGK